MQKRLLRGVGVFVFLVVSFSPSIALADRVTPYEPGETLMPTDCGPLDGDAECTVAIIPDQTGNSGKYLTTDGTSLSWGTVSSGVALSGVTAATAINTIDNTTFAQTWNWSTLTTQDALTLNFNDLTTGNGLVLSSSETTTSSGSLLSLSTASTGNLSDGILNITASAAHTGSLVKIVNSSSTAGTSLTLTSGATTGDPLVITANALTSGSALQIDSSTTGAVSNGALRVDMSAAHTGSAVAISSATASGTALEIDANSLTSGVGLDIASTGVSTTGKLLKVSTATNGTFGTGGGVDFQATGTFAGNFLYIANTGAATGNLALMENRSVSSSAPVLTLTTVGTGNVLVVNDQSSDGTPFVVTSAGFVGVGADSPGTLLQVGESGSTGNLTVVGTGTTCVVGNGTSATNCTSDKRLKTNIESIDSSLDQILALNPVTFEWKDESKPGTKIGFIAQEVDDIFPSFVDEIYDGYLGLDYAALVTPAIRSIQELYTMVTDFKYGEKENKFTVVLKDYIRDFLADFNNGLDVIYTNTLRSKIVETEKLCIGQTCITESELLEIMTRFDDEEDFSGSSDTAQDVNEMEEVNEENLEQTEGANLNQQNSNGDEQTGYSSEELENETPETLVEEEAVISNDQNNENGTPEIISE